MRRTKAGVSPDQARDVAALDDLAVSLVRRVFVPEGNPGRTILPEADLPEINLTDAPVNNAASFRTVLEELFDTYLEARGATVPKPIITWLLDAWTRTVFGGQLFVKADANGVPALHARSEIRPMTNLAGVEDLLIDLQGEENFHRIGINDFFANWGSKNLVEMWLGPMRLVHVSCAASSNAGFRNKPASNATKKLAIDVPDLDGVNVQRLETLKKSIEADQPIRVYYGRTYNAACTCHRHLKLVASSPSKSATASPPAKRKRKAARKQSTPPAARPARAAKANAPPVQRFHFEGDSEEEEVVIIDDDDDSEADYHPSPDDEDMGDAEAASDELERINSTTPGPSRRRRHESDSEDEYNPARKRPRTSKRRTVPSSSPLPSGPDSDESDGLDALNTSPVSQAGGSPQHDFASSSHADIAGPSHGTVPLSPTQRASQSNGRVAEWSSQVLPSPHSSPHANGVALGPTGANHKGKHRAISPSPTPPSFSPPPPDMGASMNAAFDPAPALGLTSTPAAMNPRSAARGPITPQDRPPISHLQVGPRDVRPPADVPPPISTVPTPEATSATHRGAGRHDASVGSSRAPPDETLPEFDAAVEHFAALRAKVARGAAAERQLRAARDELDWVRRDYERRLEERDVREQALQHTLDITKAEVAALQVQLERAKDSEQTNEQLKREVKALRQDAQIKTDELQVELSVAREDSSSKGQQLHLAHAHIRELRAELAKRETQLRERNQLIGQLKADAAAHNLPLRHLSRNGTGESSRAAVEGAGADGTPTAPRQTNGFQSPADSSTTGGRQQRTGPLPTPETSRSSIAAPEARTPAAAPPRPPARKSGVASRFWTS